MQNLKNEFEQLYRNNGNEEQKFQTFLEENSCLIPRSFMQNHGVHMDLVFRKFPFGNTYNSDFMFLSKSTTNWHAVHIEIEAPSKRIFNKDGSFASEFNKAIEQVESWKGWLDDTSNQVTFNQTINPIKKPIANTPVHHKFILVYGRSSEIETDSQRQAINAKKQNHFEIMTYDSLFESQKTILNIASLADSKIKILSTNMLSKNFFGFLNPADFKIPETIKTAVIAGLNNEISALTGLNKTLSESHLKDDISKWERVSVYSS